MTEPELRAAVFALADQLRVRWLYFGSDVRRQEGQWRGFPDALFCGSIAFLFAELKAGGKQPTGMQRGWHDDLAGAGARVAVWHPGDYHGGIVAEQLAALNGTAGPLEWKLDTPEKRLWAALRKDAERGRNASGVIPGAQRRR